MEAKKMMLAFAIVAFLLGCIADGFLIVAPASSVATPSCFSRQGSSRSSVLKAEPTMTGATADSLPSADPPSSSDEDDAAAAATAAAAAAAAGLELERQKASLMRLILATSLEEAESTKAAQEVDSIIGNLESLNQGFQEDSVDGQWVLCFTRNSEGSPSLQKALPGDRGFQNFDVRAKKFFNIVKLWGGKVQVLADVAYNVTPETPNRLESTIVGARVKIGPLPLPLPLTGRIGYLDFVYQDKDIRVTRGNRGGLFLHMRPGSGFRVEPAAAAEE